MSDYLNLNTLFNFVTAGVGIVGLILIWRYVKATVEIAEATRLQGEILSRPALTVEFDREGFLSHNKSGIMTSDSIFLKIVNHSNLHANLKLTIRYRFKTKDSEEFEEIFTKQYV